MVPGSYPTIQAAVDAADPGDTIEVSTGTYRESVWIEKSLTIIGQGESTTIVDGSKSGYAFWLDTDGVTISGFTIRDCSNYGVNAYYSGSHTVSDNIFLDNVYGVHLTNTPSASNIANNTFLNNALRGINVASSSDNVIDNNYISDSTYGIKLSGESQSNHITNNVITGASHGIYLGYSSSSSVAYNSITSETTSIVSLYSDYVDIHNNTASESAYGIEIYGSTYNTVFGNTVVQSSYGFYLLYADDNTIDSNLASNNDWGIYLYDSDRNTFVQNSFAFNAYGLEVVSYSTGNTIAWNNILNNTLQMHQDSTSGGNTWNKMTGGTTYGNYWSNYTGDDTDDPPDGVGDTLLPHRGVDYYPLINPWNTVHDSAVVSVTASDTAVYQGHIVNVTVVVRNEGTANETFDVTAKYFNRPFGTKRVTNLAPLRTTTLVFRWNTTSVPPGFYCEVSAETELIVGETDSFDNTYIDGDVHVKLPGDIDGDNMVGSADVSVFNGAYGAYDGDPQYVRAADFNLDGYIGSADAGILSDNYGKTC